MIAICMLEKNIDTFVRYIIKYLFGNPANFLMTFQFEVFYFLSYASLHLRNN